MAQSAVSSDVFTHFRRPRRLQHGSLIHIRHFYITDIKGVRKLRVCIPATNSKPDRQNRDRTPQSR